MVVICYITVTNLQTLAKFVLCFCVQLELLRQVDPPHGYPLLDN